MAAYAALVSVMHIIDQIRHHPNPPISLDKNQVQSFAENVTFMQEFLEAYSQLHNEEADQLQSRIADAAYAAEDVIESHIVDQIHAKSTKDVEEIGGSAVDFYQALQKVIREMDLIKKEVMEVKENMGSAHVIQLHKSSSVPPADGSRSPLKGQNIVVGLDDVLYQFMDKLTGHQSNRQIILIGGMGGIGKTTLAKNAYENPLIVHHFDICAWVTISQEYNMKEIIIEVLSCQKNQGIKETLHSMTAPELGELLHKSLFGRRYLIVMDDVWNIEVWDHLKFYLPDNNNKSRIIVTTRLTIQALRIPAAFTFEMNFLDEELSWDLLCKVVFGEDGCPLELEAIGKEIAQKCNGLPLSIVVIGGLLAKSQKTREYWEDIVKNLNSIVNLEDNERCFKLLYLSYNRLPVHLKPCFLYMGVFPEDTKIRVSDLIKLWVAEGFLKPVIEKSSEEIAEEYLEDLISRNLILILKWKWDGKAKLCKIHDLVRDLCLREAQKERFLYLIKPHSVENYSQRTKRCIVSYRSTEVDFREVCDALDSASLARSFIWGSSIFTSRTIRLVRVWKYSFNESLDDYFFKKVNLRYLGDYEKPFFILQPGYSISSSVHLLWNLQTLNIKNSRGTIEIWRMPLLKNVEIHKLFLPDHPDNLSSNCFGMSDEQDDFVLGNLRRLSTVVNFRCNEKTVKMIRDIEKLGISYEVEFEGSHYCLNNLACLHKLESLNLNFHPEARPRRSDLKQNLSFPHSLKKLTLEGCNLHWEDISIKIGTLPLLQVLKIKRSSCGPQWETVEGQFLSLKILQIEGPCDLKCWTTDNTHFPCLEHLVLTCVFELEGIPSDIGDITTLQSIELHNCSHPVIFSAKDILKDQEELGNESLQVRVFKTIGDDDNQALESLASHNFKIQDESCPIL